MGFQNVARMFYGTCVYRNSNNVLCNNGCTSQTCASNSHSWRYLSQHNPGPSSALSTRRYPFVWGKGVLNGYSSTRVSLWDSLMFGRVLEY